MSNDRFYCAVCRVEIPANRLLSHLIPHSPTDGRSRPMSIYEMAVQAGQTYVNVATGERVQPGPSLADAITADLEALHVDVESDGPLEMPRPERDLTAYADAFASAAANCQHDDRTEMLWGREWLCNDCGRYVDLAEMRRVRQSR